MDSETLAEVPRGKSIRSSTAQLLIQLDAASLCFCFLCTTKQHPGNSEVLGVEGQEIEVNVIELYDSEI